MANKHVTESPNTRKMQIKVTSHPSDWQKFKRMLMSTTDGSARRSMFSYVTGEKENWYCLFGKQYKKHFLKKSCPSTQRSHS